VGVPPYRWLLRQRVLRAKTLLRGQEHTLSEIAAACGFADQSTSRGYSRTSPAPAPVLAQTGSLGGQSTPAVGLSVNVPSALRAWWQAQRTGYR
jgi:AraC-like DNA-binding protein